MAKSGKPRGNKTRDWVIRLAVFVPLIVLIVLAYLDNQKKQQATKTGQAWRELLEVANQNDFGHLPLAKLAESMDGSPVVAENELENVYTWKGIFREYVIKVTYDLGAAKPVEQIDGP